MKLKHKIIIAYLIVGILYALYAWNFGDTAHKSFAYNLGQGLVWPAVIFPGLGKIIGGIIFIGLISLIILS